MESKERDWIDITSKVLPPLLTAVLVALFGFMGNSFLSRQESARLVTQMQINRENKYEDVRLKIFEKAIDKLINQKPDHDDIEDQLAEKMLNLELLAHNFGSAISLSPLFLDLKRELDDFKSLSRVSELKADTSEQGQSQSQTDGEEKASKEEKQYDELKDRLESLARNVGSKQIAVLEPQGKVVKVHVNFPEEIPKGDCETATTKLENFAYTWLKSESNILKDDDEKFKEIVKGAWDVDSYSRNPQHYAFLTVSKIDICEKQVKVQAKIERLHANRTDESDFSKSVFRDFSVNYYNFPMIDNTLVGNQLRFAVTLDDFNTEKKPNIVLKMMFFPAEYSKQSRPNLRETMKVLREASKAI